jgi:hypothetical protein
MELVGQDIRVNSLTPTSADPSEQHERALRWGRESPPPFEAIAAFERFPNRRADAEVAKAEQPRTRCGVPHFVRRGDDHRGRPSRRRRRLILGLEPKPPFTAAGRNADVFMKAIDPAFKPSL